MYLFMPRLPPTTASTAAALGPICYGVLDNQKVCKFETIVPLLFVISVPTHFKLIPLKTTVLLMGKEYIMGICTHIHDYRLGIYEMNITQLFPVYSGKYF